MSGNDYLRGLQRSWDTYGAEDPLWAICVDPSKQNNRWDPDDFFAMGRRSVWELMQWCARHGFPRRRGACLDFGCGVGRLTQALAGHFVRAVGVDIAPSMIEKARAYNRHGDRCEYVVNLADGLPLFRDGSFDLIYTEYVLQHMNPALAKGYIREMLRVLRPGGLLCFQLPSRLPRFEYPEGMAFEISVERDTLTLSASETVSIHVAVSNTGRGVWDAKGDPRTPVRLCHHWCDLNTGETRLIQGHLTLPSRVEPGQTLYFEYPLRAPDAFGHYACVLDLVDFDGVLFSGRGSMPCTLECVVVPSSPAAHAGASSHAKAEAPRPNMEMHAIAEKEIAGLLRECGAVLADCTRTGDRIDEVRETRYYVTK